MECLLEVPKSIQKIPDISLGEGNFIISNNNPVQNIFFVTVHTYSNVRSTFWYMSGSPVWEWTFGLVLLFVLFFVRYKSGFCKTFLIFKIFKNCTEP